ncbi:MAG TPA: hypothetical protein VN824_12830, partial [Puia sp.]|nr:hypothetical protein [Puia sp.]
MKTLNLLTVLFLTLIALNLFSCSKGNSPAPPSNPGGGISNPVGSIRINLEYPVDYNGSIQQGSTFELIISETGGKILLDTIGTTNTAISATLKTNSTLVDLTTVYRPNDGASGYTVETYKSVGPSGWGAAKKVVGAIPIPNFPFEQGNITYFHVPLTEPSAVDPQWQQFYPTLRTEGLNTFYDSGTNHLSVSYIPYPGPGHYAYLVLPAAGLYDLHMVTGNNDTVDLSHMSQAAKLHFTL